MKRQTQQQHYPFAAIVGQDDLKLCLILCAIDPTIGGVLIRGDKGTAKSTAARGIAKLMPSIQVRYDPELKVYDPYNRDIDMVEVDAITGDAILSSDDSMGDDDEDEDNMNIKSYKEVREIATPFVDLPIGSTEDRVLGSIDFSATIKQGGKRVFAPGLLASANRGVLYIDEVNLLPAHLVDVVLDSAAMGVNTVQREGISMSHPAKFMLIGTMNQEEGDLRPQLLDRFGLMIDVTAPTDYNERAEVVRQRMSFERDASSFHEQWDNIEIDLAHKIRTAKNRLSQVVLSDNMLLLISRICSEMNVGSLRADITMYKTAMALASWEGRIVVENEDIRRAADWVLAHRRRRQPFDSPMDNTKDTSDLLDELTSNRQDDKNNSEDKSDNSEHHNQNPPPEGSSVEDNTSNGRSSNAEKNNDQNNNGGDDMQTFTASKPNEIKKLKLGKQQKGSNTNGKRNQVNNTQTGHYVRSVPTDKAHDIALDATLRSAAANGLDESGLPIILPDNWRRKARNSTTDTIILFVVDASGSMSARQRMESVKGSVLALLTDAYQQRDRVGVIAFRGIKAEILLEPTKSVELAEKQLKRLPTGGRTPLAHAFSLSYDTIQRLRRHEPEQAILLIVLSDGKANVALPESSPGCDCWTQTEQVATKLATLDVPTLMLDTETGNVYARVGRGKELAQSLNADYLQLDELSSDNLVHIIRQATC